MLEHAPPLHLEHLAVLVLCMELALQNCVACVCFVTLNSSIPKGPGHTGGSDRVSSARAGMVAEGASHIGVWLLNSSD